MKCPNCGCNDTEELIALKNTEKHYLTPFKKNGNRGWRKCKQCNIGFSTPRLTEKEIEWMYENYRNDSFRNQSPEKYFEEITSLSNEKSENYQKFIYIHSNLYKFKPKSVLDIGCGGGVLIHELKKHWKDARYYGIEPSPNFAELAQKKTGADIKNGFFSGSTEYKDKFDLILCCQVLEHIELFEEFLKAIRENLGNSGYVYLEVPDQSDFTHLEKEHTRFSEPSHLWYFSKTVLDKVMCQVGFNILQSDVKKTIRGRNNLMYILNK